MSFSMKDIKRNIKTNEYNIRDYKKLIDTYDLLTPGIKDKLLDYTRYRLFIKKTNIFNTQKFDSMIKDLLEFITGKTYNEVTKEDIIQNHNAIISEITKSICSGSVNKLYYSNDNGVIDKFKINQKLPKSLNNYSRDDKNKLEDYYRGMMI